MDKLSQQDLVRDSGTVPNGKIPMRPNEYRHVEKLEDGINLVKIDGKEMISISIGRDLLGPRMEGRRKGR